MSMHTSARAPRVDAKRRNGQATPTATLKWETPPKKAGGRRAVLVPQVGALLPQVKSKPGTWARILTYPKAPAASAARRTLIDAFPGFEFVVRRVLDENVSAVYVRWPA